ncbi:MAG: family transposase [Actinomycetia bacterium]|nr:family transposase [Actinomycetes bacterium]
MQQHDGWDHALKVTADGKGLVGHAGAVLLRKAADQAGLTAQLSAALRRKGTGPEARSSSRRQEIAAGSGPERSFARGFGHLTSNWPSPHIGYRARVATVRLP